MNTEQAWERITESLDYLVGELQRSDVAIDAGHAALEALTFLRSEMERLERERDAAATFAQNVDDLRVARIAELEAEVSRLTKEAITAALVKAKTDTRIAELEGE